MKLVTDKACFTVRLRNACLAIALLFIGSMVVGVIARPNYLNYMTSLFGLMLELTGNLSLFFGTLWHKHWLVLVWLIQAVIILIIWPIAFFGAIYDYGDFRLVSMFDDVTMIIVEYLVILVVFLYCTYIVYSFYHHLRTSPSHTTSA